MGRNKGGRGNGSRGRGRGRSRGRGRGGMMACGREVAGSGLHQNLLTNLKEHLLLGIFNMLDDNSRISAFRAVGWSTKNYFQRKENLRKQMKAQAKNRKELEEREKWMKGIFHSVLNAGLNGQVQGDIDEEKIGATMEHSFDVAEESKFEEEKKESEVNGQNSSVEDADKVDEVERATCEISKLDVSSKDSVKEVLPFLGARIDPGTLLERLNTRRLFQRIKYYNKQKRGKKEAEAELLKTLAEKGGRAPPLSIIDMYERDLKEKLESDHIYPKNLTISQMAEKEWNQLLEMAEMRLSGFKVPFDPIPTNHELLLFSPCPRAVAVLASYPRSGNSLMRTLYEHTTLRVTGSDMQGGLAKHDLVGEMAVGENNVQFVKTHYPERRGTPAFRTSRAVLLVRNPFDAIESFFNLMLTGSHTTSISKEVRLKADKVFHEFAVKEAVVWWKFHEYWLKQDIPILLIRYEDLYRHTDKVMERTLQFVLEVQRMGTFFTERVDRCIREQQEIERLGSYKPRSAGIGKSLSKYPPEVIQKMKTPELISIMEKLGYKYLLDNPPENWSKMPPLQDYATEMMSASCFVNGEKNTIILNQGELSRGEAEFTPWNKIKQELGISNQDQCDCDQCKIRAKLNTGH